MLAKAEKFGSRTTYKIPNDALAYFRNKEDKASLLKKPAKPKNLGKGLEQEQLEGFKAACLRGDMSKHGEVFSQTTADAYVYYLNRFYAVHSELTILTLQIFINSFSKKQFATKGKVYKAALCFAKYLHKIDMADEQLLEDIKQYKVPEKKKDKLEEGRRLKTLSADQLNAMLASCTDDLDKVLLTVLSNTGVRAGNGILKVYHS